MRRRVAALALVALALAVPVAVSGSAPGDTALVVSEVETGDRLFATGVENGTTVALEYTHSVEKSPVTEVYAVRGDRLVQTRIEFESYGWGLPTGANVTEVNGTFVARPNRTMSTLTVAPGRIAGHELRVGDVTYDLVNRSDGRSVRIDLVRCSPAAVTSSESQP